MAQPGTENKLSSDTVSHRRDRQTYRETGAGGIRVRCNDWFGGFVFRFSYEWRMALDARTKTLLAMMNRTAPAQNRPATKPVGFSAVRRPTVSAMT